MSEGQIVFLLTLLVLGIALGVDHFRGAHEASLFSAMGFLVMAGVSFSAAYVLCECRIAQLFTGDHEGFLFALALVLSLAGVLDVVRLVSGNDVEH